jgi:WS/DGAT/MGAT family acyltransferase
MEQLGGLESFMLHDEQGNRYNHVAALGIYDPSASPDGKTRFKDILRHFSNRLADFPIFRRRLVSAPYGIDRPYWVEDDQIDIEFHIRHIALPHPGDMRQLMIQVARLHSRPLDRSRPLWEIYVIEGLERIPGMHHGCFALFMKFHHAAVDSQAVAALLQAVHASEPDEDYVPQHARRKQRHAVRPSTLTFLRNAAGNGASRTLDLSALYVGSAARLGAMVWEKLPRLFRGSARQSPGLYLEDAPATRFNHAVSANRSVDALSLPMDEIRRLRQSLPDINLNDVFLAICAGGLRAYLQAKGELPDQTLRALMPINPVEKLVSKRKRINNNFSGAPIALHTELADPLERLQLVHREILASKRDGTSLGLELLPELLGNLPETAGRPLLRHLLLCKVNLAASLVYGSEAPLYVAGARLLQYYPMSIATDQLGLNISAFSYNDRLWISVVACRNMLPDPAFFIDCLHKSFQQLLAAGGHPASTNRRRKSSMAAAATRNARTKTHSDALS